MHDNIFDEILRKRELKNERIVAVARFSFITFAGFMDLLAYFHLIQYTAIVPLMMTLVLDFLFMLFSAVILVIVIKAPYHFSMKFFTLTLDYLFIGILLLFDPTVQRDGEIIYWISLVASLFIFMYNLIRFSKVGTIYSACLSLIFFVVIGSLTNGGGNLNILPMMTGLAMMLAIGYYITITHSQMMREANTKKMMERFLPPQLMDELYKHQDNMSPMGKHQRVTILFSDIRAFTELSEDLPATQVVTLLNDYLSTMTEIIFKYEGTIDKFIGDAIMTIFGAPLQLANDEERAIFTALDMLNGLKNVNERHPELRSPLKIGVGIHTGEVIVGNIGSEKRLDYTVIGDNVNMSSRIEGLTKFYQCPILVSEKTMKAFLLSPNASQILTRELDTVRVKGKTQSIKIFEVMCFSEDSRSEEFSKLKMAFEAGLALYKSQKFTEALVQFATSPNDPPSLIYAQRCRDYLANPPLASWDGSFVMMEK
jgi:adenylate cyclase